MNGGYLEVRAWDHPHARKNGFIYAHILAAEAKIGRYLKKGEVVHHINGVKTDNTESNILVFKSNKEHLWFHRGGVLKTTDEYGVFGCFKNSATANKNICPTCGMFKHKKSKTCKKCYDSLDIHKIINKTILFQICEYHTVKELSDILGVSINAIYYMCKKYNLGHKK